MHMRFNQSRHNIFAFRINHLCDRPIFRIRIDQMIQLSRRANIGDDSIFNADLSFICLISRNDCPVFNNQIQHIVCPFLQNL